MRKRLGREVKGQGRVKATGRGGTDGLIGQVSGEVMNKKTGGKDTGL